MISVGREDTSQTYLNSDCLRHLGGVSLGLGGHIHNVGLIEPFDFCLYIAFTVS